MRRFAQRRRPSAFGARDTLRLVSMIGMLVILGLMIARARDPNLWRWLVDEPPNPPKTASLPAAVKGTQKPSPEPAASAHVQAPGDQDPEEQDAIREEFQAVSDGTLAIQREEMPAYDRLLRWAQQQSTASMLQRADRNVVYTQFVQRPQEWRGRLVALELHIRRILKYERNGVPLYEVWGWTNEAKAWLYVGVVVDLPNDMPVGTDVAEEGTLVGYFFKLQGYHEAGAQPHALPLRAPLLIGRLDWHRRVAPPARQSGLPLWAWAVLGLVVAMAVLQIAIPLARLGRRATRLPAEAPPAPRWLLEPEEMEPESSGPEDDDPLDT